MHLVDVDGKVVRTASIAGSLIAQGGTHHASNCTVRVSPRGQIAVLEKSSRTLGVVDATSGATCTMDLPDRMTALGVMHHTLAFSPDETRLALYTETTGQAAIEADGGFGRPFGFALGGGGGKELVCVKLNVLCYGLAGCGATG